MPNVKCKECGKEINLDPHTYWTVNDMAVRCLWCQTINTITLEKGKLRKQV
jgi:hypothetical protein